MGDRVDVPPDDCLSGGLGPIVLPQLLSGDGVFTVRVRILVGTEKPVHLVEEVIEHLAPLSGCSFNGLSGHYALSPYRASTTSVTSRPQLHDAHSPPAIP